MGNGAQDVPQHSRLLAADEMMTKRPSGHRRFNLADAMILVAAAAIGLGLARSYLPWLEAPFAMQRTRARPMPPVPFWVGAASTWITILLPCALAVTLSLPMLRCRYSGWRRACRCPGLGASIASCFILAAVALGVTCRELDHSSGDWVNATYSAFRQFGDLNGLAIGAVWTVLAIGGIWRPSSEPVERLGKVLGSFWIGVSILDCCLLPLAMALG